MAILLFIIYFVKLCIKFFYWLLVKQETELVYIYTHIGPVHDGDCFRFRGLLHALYRGELWARARVGLTSALLYVHIQVSAMTSLYI